MPPSFFIVENSTEHGVAAEALIDRSFLPIPAGSFPRGDPAGSAAIRPWERDRLRRGAAKSDSNQQSSAALVAARAAPTRARISDPRGSSIIKQATESRIPARRPAPPRASEAADPSSLQRTSNPTANGKSRAAAVAQPATGPCVRDAAAQSYAAGTEATSRPAVAATTTARNAQRAFPAARTTRERSRSDAP